MGAPENPYVRATAATLGRLGIDVERLDPAGVHARYPQIAVAGLGEAVFEPQAGMVRARLAVRSLVDLMTTRRMIEYQTARVAPLDESRARPDVSLTSGDRVAADIYVCACGPWLPSLLPIAVGDRIRATRQEVLYFGVPAGDDRYSLARLPVWIDFEAGLYGIPDVDSCGFKVGIDRHGPEIDPDRHERVLSRQVVDETRAWLARRFPGMADAPLLDGHVCQYREHVQRRFHHRPPSVVARASGLSAAAPATGSNTGPPWAGTSRRSSTAAQSPSRDSRLPRKPRARLGPCIEARKKPSADCAD